MPTDEWCPYLNIFLPGSNVLEKKKGGGILLVTAMFNSFKHQDF